MLRISMTFDFFDEEELLENKADFEIEVFGALKPLIERLVDPMGECSERELEFFRVELEKVG